MPLQKSCAKCGKKYPAEAVLCSDDGFPLILLTATDIGDLKIGQRYAIEQELGRGGMGIIYKARHIAMNRHVAVKLLLADISQDPEAMSRFQVEARAASVLSHPNIIKVFEFDFTEHGMPYLVMEYHKGKTLDVVLDKLGEIPYQSAVPIFIALTNALSHAHNRNVVHRDLKPSNVIMTKDDDDQFMPIILDFGIAKLFAQPGKTAQRLTLTGEIFGSPLYMSPEQCMGQTVDPRSDIYSLGCMMYEMLTGVPPIDGNNFLALVYAHLNEAPTTFAEAAPDTHVPEELQKIILKCLRKSPADRHASMKDLRAALENLFYQPDTSSGASASKSERANVEQSRLKDETVRTHNEDNLIKEIFKKAEAGDADSQLELANMFASGQLVEQDQEQAFSWYKKAASQNNAEAIYWLGRCYRYGTGIENNFTQARRSFEKAAELGHGGAIYQLGAISENGEGCATDCKKAYEYYKEAADKNFAPAFESIGYLYEMGLGVEQDEKRAAQWYLKAAEKNQVYAQFKIGQFYAAGTGVKQDMEEAASWYACAAQNGDAEARVELSYCYLHGDGVEPDGKEALRWMTYAAEAGVARAQTWLGYWCLSGDLGLKKNAERAIDWYTKAAEQNYANAMYRLGLIYEVGDGVKPNHGLAFDWYLKAANAGDKDGQQNLANCYAYGVGVEKDVEMAHFWTTQSENNETYRVLITTAKL